MQATAGAQTVAAAATRSGAKRRACAAKRPLSVSHRQLVSGRAAPRGRAATPSRAAPLTRAQASLAAGARARSPPPPSEVSLGGKLRAVCQVFFPPRVTPRQAMKERVSCVLTMDRSSLLPEEETSIEERVRHVMEEYVELQQGMGDYAPTKLEKRLDEASGSAIYSLSFRVKRTRAAAAADEMPLQA